MISIRLGDAGQAAQQAPAVAYPVAAVKPPAEPRTNSTPNGEPAVGKLLAELPDDLAAEVTAYLQDIEHRGRAGVLHTLPRPLRVPAKVLLVGVGDADEAGWRAAGAALARSAARESELTVLAPATLSAEALRGLAEGIWLASYRYSLVEDKPDKAPRLQTVTIAVESTPERENVLATARVVAEQTLFARDLTNTPSLTKNPAWFVEQVRERVSDDITLSVREPAQLADEGFGGILAVGGGSVHGARLLELRWQPERADTHVVLVGKGITYDTGGIDIKPIDGMQLMRKDMGGAATVVGAILAAAQLKLPVRVTVLAPLAENMISGSSWRSGDVVTHYGGLTSEIHSTDAEGRVVVADAMAYAVEQLAPDLLIDLATLTGASRIALGKKTAALFGDNDDLVKALSTAAAEAGESVWRMPLADDYAKDVVAELADLNNAAGNPGAITAALYLREFAGPMRDRWAHIDMSAPSWSASTEAELAKGATGWGVRTLVRWLSTL
jgi:leucyl aminopeptidase